jgi:hypothetical protein
MASAPRDVWITGIGIVSCLGEGPEAHWRGLNEPTPIVDVKTFTPYAVHPLCRVDFDKQIPKKGDQRQMEPWQRIGTYAAGLALDSASAKGNSDLLGRMDMIVAAGGGERDWAADGAILSGLPKANDPERFLNERLMSDLRPTLFLAQLSNLLAGNISIVHGVTGSSRTFMGEELAGVDAVRIALQRIRANQSHIALVGGAQNGERKDLLMLYDFGGFGLKGDFSTSMGARACPWIRPGLDGGVSGPGEPRACGKAECGAACQVIGGRGRLCGAPTRNGRSQFGQDLERSRLARFRCRRLRRDRYRARDIRGTQFPQAPSSARGACHWEPFRSWRRAAVHHEHCGCHTCGPLR